MTSALPDNWQELVAGYALGDLSPEEAEELQRLLANNPNLTVEVASLQEVLALMPYALPQQEPSAQLRNSILAAVEVNPVIETSNHGSTSSISTSSISTSSISTDSISTDSISTDSISTDSISVDNRTARNLIDSDSLPIIPIQTIAPLQSAESEEALQKKRRNLRRGRWAATWYGIGGAIAAVALVALGIDNYRLRQEAEQSKSVIAALQQRGTQTIAMEGTETANSASGSLVVAKSRQVFIVAKNLPVLPEGQVYRLWAMPSSGKNPAFCGQFSAKTSGSITTQWVTPEASCQSTTVQMLITSEKASDPPVPKGSLVMQSHI
jgi:anti-sigma-K factor RskA